MTIKINTRVRVTDKFVPHLTDSKYLGAEGVVTDHRLGANVVDFDRDEFGKFGTWTDSALEIIEEAPATTPARPLIDFSGNSRATAREYAKAANSRVLTAKSQADLKAASLGMQVDAYNLNEAILDAMRSASTRLGQSMARRDLTRKIAYLGHITQAVLENHADGLPVYADGERSRKVKALETEVHDLKLRLANQGSDLLDAQTSFRGQSSLHREKIATLEAEKSALDERVTDIVADMTIAQAEAESLREEVAALRATIQFAGKHLDAGVFAEIVGYEQGQIDARRRS